MFFLLPIGVEGNEVRVPIVCIGILFLCLVGFFGTWVLPSHNPVDPEALTQVLKQYKEHPYLSPPKALFEQLDSAIIDRFCSTCE